MTSFPKPPPPIKNKGQKEWNAYRQKRLSGFFFRGGQPCKECGIIMEVWMENGRLQSWGVFHHKKRRLSHPELKYDDSNIDFICPDCHAKHH